MLGSLHPIWDNARAYIIGGGPSVNDLDPEVLRGKHVVAVNNAYTVIPWADVLYFMDCEWYNWNKEKILSFAGLKITTCKKLDKIPGFLSLQHGIRNGVDMRPEFLSRGASSGQGAMNVAIKLGAKELVLIGFDMRVVDGVHNFHNDHGRKVPASIYLDQHAKSLKYMVPIAESLGIKIVNCTQDSAIDFISIEPLEKWL